MRIGAVCMDSALILRDPGLRNTGEGTEWVVLKA